ncbi:WW domain protein [Toxoplasma gondii TgCatPRC2]|uniref:WW domain protein n=1 Tax=Toxoplasma gondii TgCatPRC2 TaxID=1130821 RepID=A0A151H7P6_TOXGO|nr:WW domain protein [Toxoplasma gondii TgCatPRC2]
MPETLSASPQAEHRRDDSENSQGRSVCLSCEAEKRRMERRREATAGEEVDPRQTQADTPRKPARWHTGDTSKHKSGRLRKEKDEDDQEEEEGEERGAKGEEACVGEQDAEGESEEGGEENAEEKEEGRAMKGEGCRTQETHVTMQWGVEERQKVPEEEDLLFSPCSLSDCSPVWREISEEREEREKDEEEDSDPEFVFLEDRSSTWSPTPADLLVCAKRLGFVFPEDSPFLCLARECLTAPLPAPWVACQSRRDGSIFFFNPETRASVWENPGDAIVREKLAAARLKHRRAAGETEGSCGRSQGASDAGPLSVRIGASPGLETRCKEVAAGEESRAADPPELAKRDREMQKARRWGDCVKSQKDEGEGNTEMKSKTHTQEDQQKKERKEQANHEEEAERGEAHEGETGPQRGVLCGLPVSGHANWGTNVLFSRATPRAFAGSEKEDFLEQTAKGDAKDGTILASLAAFHLPAGPASPGDASSDSSPSFAASAAPLRTSPSKRATDGEPQEKREIGLLQIFQVAGRALGARDSALRQLDGEMEAVELLEREACGEVGALSWSERWGENEDACASSSCVLPSFAPPHLACSAATVAPSTRSSHDGGREALEREEAARQKREVEETEGERGGTEANDEEGRASEGSGESDGDGGREASEQRESHTAETHLNVQRGDAWSQTRAVAEEDGEAAEEDRDACDSHRGHSRAWKKKREGAHALRPGDKQASRVLEESGENREDEGGATRTPLHASRRLSCSFHGEGPSLAIVSISQTPEREDRRGRGEAAEAGETSRSCDWTKDETLPFAEETAEAVEAARRRITRNETMQEGEEESPTEKVEEEDSAKGREAGTRHGGEGGPALHASCRDSKDANKEMKLSRPKSLKDSPPSDLASSATWGVIGTPYFFVGCTDSPGAADAQKGSQQNPAFRLPSASTCASLSSLPGSRECLQSEEEGVFSSISRAPSLCGKRGEKAKPVGTSRQAPHLDVCHREVATNEPTNESEEAAAGADQTDAGAGEEPEEAEKAAELVKNEAGEAEEVAAEEGVYDGGEMEDEKAGDGDEVDVKGGDEAGDEMDVKGGEEGEGDGGAGQSDEGRANEVEAALPVTGEFRFDATKERPALGVAERSEEERNLSSEGNAHSRARQMHAFSKKQLEEREILSRPPSSARFHLSPDLERTAWNEANASVLSDLDSRQDKKAVPGVEWSCEESARMKSGTEKEDDASLRLSPNSISSSIVAHRVPTSSSSPCSLPSVCVSSSASSSPSSSFTAQTPAKPLFVKAAEEEQEGEQEGEQAEGEERGGEEDEQEEEQEGEQEEEQEREQEEEQEGEQGEGEEREEGRMKGEATLEGCGSAWSSVGRISWRGETCTGEQKTQGKGQKPFHERQKEERRQEADSRRERKTKHRGDPPPCGKGVTHCTDITGFTLDLAFLSLDLSVSLKEVEYEHGFDFFCFTRRSRYCIYRERIKRGRVAYLQSLAGRK